MIYSGHVTHLPSLGISNILP